MHVTGTHSRITFSMQIHPPLIRATGRDGSKLLCLHILSMKGKETNENNNQMVFYIYFVQFLM